MGKIISAAIVLLVFVWIYVAVFYVYNKKKNGGVGCNGDCSHCGAGGSCDTTSKK